MSGPTGSLPDFVIAGAMRSGTTSLTRYLGAHPEIFIAPKELGFFTERFDEGIDWYRGFFSDVGDARLCGESTADYLARGDAMNRLSRTLPDARIIAILRNPVERAWSHYWLQRERGKDGRSFEEAIEFEIRAIDAEGPTAEGVFYVFHSLYDTQLEHVLGLFPRDRLSITVFERMVEDPVSSYRSICSWLGVDAEEIPEIVGKRINPYVTFRSLRVRSLSHRLPPLMRRAVGRLNTRRDASYPEIPPGASERLVEFFAPRIARVEAILGEEIEEWHPSLRS